jgi:hypothetical protein
MIPHPLLVAREWGVPHLYKWVVPLPATIGRVACQKGYSRFQIWLIRIFGGCSFNVKIEKDWNPNPVTGTGQDLWHEVLKKSNICFNPLLRHPAEQEM